MTAARRYAPLALFILALAAASASAAAPLRGVVKKNEVGGEGMAQVAISAADANPVHSDSQGLFSLNFPRLQAGERVVLSVAKPGWVVVNDLQLETFLPKDARAHPLTLLLAKPAEKQRWAEAYYRLKGRENVEAEYRARLAQLEQDQKAGQKERERLARERDLALSQADELARQLAALQPGEGDALYREASRLYLDGRLQDALRVLDEKKLQDQTAQAEKLEAAAQQMRQEASRNWRLRGKMLAQSYQFVEAGKAYTQATRATPEDIETWFEYAVFHQQQNRFAAARQGYEKALTLARAGAEGAANVATILNNLGLLHQNQNRMEAARLAFEEALTIHRELAQANPEVYRPGVAMTLNNLGNLHHNQNRMDAARLAYEEALTIRRELARANPEVYRPDVAMTLNNLGVLHQNQNRMEAARLAFEVALKIRRELAQANPDVYLPDVAMTLNNLGVLHWSQNRMDAARLAYEEALTLYRELARANPEVYRWYVACTLNNLGNLHQNRMEAARLAFEEALTIHRELARANPEVYRPYVAMTLNNLGILHSDQNRMEAARLAFEEALNIYQEFAAQNPGTFVRELAGVRRILDELK